MFDTSFRWTLLKIVVIGFALLLVIDFLLVKILGLFLAPNLATVVARLVIGVFVVAYFVLQPMYSSFRKNKIIDDLTDPEHKSFFKQFGATLTTFGLCSLVLPNRFGIVPLFEVMIGVCLYSLGSGRIQVREKGLFTQFGLLSWEHIESYESNVLGIVLRQKGWRKFFPVLIKVVPWQRTKLEKYLAELNPYIKKP